jgi:hypothetical protein
MRDVSEIGVERFTESAERWRGRDEGWSKSNKDIAAIFGYYGWSYELILKDEMEHRRRLGDGGKSRESARRKVSP